MRKIWKKRLGVALTAAIIAELTDYSGSETSSTEVPKEMAATTIGTTAARPRETEAAKEKDMTLTYMVSRNWVDKGSNVDDELNKKFEEETGVKIDMQVIPDDQYVSVLKTKLGTGEVPGIFIVSGGVETQKFVPEKYFADLSNEERVSRYAEYARQGTTIDGKIMGLMTWNVDGQGILYNKDLCKESGLEVPETFEEFCSNGNALLTKGITPVYGSGKEAWHWTIWPSGYDPYAAKQHEGLCDKLNKNEMKFVDMSESEQFLDKFKTIYDRGYLGQNSLTNTWDAAYEALGTNQAIGYLGYRSYQNEVKDKYAGSTAKTQKMFPIPSADNSMYSHSTGDDVRVAYKDLPSLEYIRELFNFLTRENNLKMSYGGRADLQSSPSPVDVPEKATAAGESILKNSEGEGMEMEYGVLYQGNTAVGRYIQEVLPGQKSAKQVLESVNDDGQRIFAATSR